MKSPVNQNSSNGIPIPTEKRCTKCPEQGLQPLSAFSKVPSASDGHSTQCKKCQNKATRKREQQKRANRDMFPY